MQPHAGVGQQILRDADLGYDTNGDLRHYLRYAMIEHAHPIDTLVKEEAGIRIGLLAISLGHYCNDCGWYMDSCNEGGEISQETTGSLQEL